MMTAAMIDLVLDLHGGGIRSVAAMAISEEAINLATDLASDLDAFLRRPTTDGDVATLRIQLNHQCGDDWGPDEAIRDYVRQAKDIARAVIAEIARARDVADREYPPEERRRDEMAETAYDRAKDDRGD